MGRKVRSLCGTLRLDPCEDAGNCFITLRGARRSNIKLLLCEPIEFSESQVAIAKIAPGYAAVGKHHREYAYLTWVVRFSRILPEHTVIPRVERLVFLHDGGKTS
jgi:hypothetical protein